MTLSYKARLLLGLVVLASSFSPILAQTGIGPAKPQRPPLEANAIFRCALVGGMALDDYRGPKEAARHLMMAETYWCLNREMPSDWPGRADARATAEREMAAAAAMDPNLSKAPPVAR